MGAGASAGSGQEQLGSGGGNGAPQACVYADCPHYEVRASRTLCVPPSLRGQLCKLILGKEALVVADDKTEKPIVLFPYYRILSWGSNLGSVQFRVVVSEKPKRDEPIDPLSPPKNPAPKKGERGDNGGGSDGGGSGGGTTGSGNSGKESAKASTRDDSEDAAKAAKGKGKEAPAPPPSPADMLQHQKTVTIAFLTIRGKDIEKEIMTQVKTLMSKMDSMVRAGGREEGGWGGREKERERKRRNRKKPKERESETERAKANLAHLLISQLSLHGNRVCPRNSSRS